MYCSMRGFPVLHHLPEFAKTQWCSLTLSSWVVLLSFCLQSFLPSRYISVSQLFASGGQNIGASAWASVLPINIQGWIPLGLTGLISLQSKWLSRVFYSINIRKNQFFSVQPFLWSNSPIHTCCCCCCYVASVVFDSVWPHRRQPTRLPLVDSPGKNAEVGCHFLQCMKVKRESEVAQSCLTLRDPVDCSLPGSSIHGIFQSRVLEWGAIAFSIVG